MGFLKVIEIILNAICVLAIFVLICQSASQKSNLKALMKLTNFKSIYIKNGVLHDKYNISEYCLIILIDMFAMFGSAAVLAIDNGFVICGAIVAAVEALYLLYNLIAHLCGFNTYNRHVIVEALKNRTHESVNKALTVENIEAIAYLVYLVAVIVGLFM